MPSNDTIRAAPPGIVPRPLLLTYPEIATGLPWLDLGEFPTPVTRLLNLESDLKVRSLWLKRDDLSGAIYGGNKVRTLEIILAQAQKERAEIIASYSALGSNWPTACTLYAHQLGFQADVYFMPYPMDDIKQQNLQIVQKFARQIHVAKSKLIFPFMLWRALREARRDYRVYLAPPGGNSAVTAIAFVNAILELKRQVDSGALPRPDVIFCPLGSGGTAAGLAVGLNLIGWPTELVAVRIVDYVVANRLTLSYLIRRIRGQLRKYGVRTSMPHNYRIEHGFFGSGYSEPLAAGEESKKVTREKEGLLLDTTYTAKAFAALLKAGKSGELAGKHVLFWHTLNSRPLEKLIS